MTTPHPRHITPADDACLAEGDWYVTVAHTPGRCANSICLALPGVLLLSGDHVMAWSTTVVSHSNVYLGGRVARLDNLLARGRRSMCRRI